MTLRIYDTLTREKREFVPVHPGRNLAALIEVAALNQRLRQHGVFSARELNDRLIHRMAGPSRA